LSLVLEKVDPTLGKVKDKQTGVRLMFSV